MNNIVKVKYDDFILFTMIREFCFNLVCIKTVEKFAEGLSDEEKSSPEKIEKSFKNFCKKVKIDTKEHRLVMNSKKYFLCINSVDFSHFSVITSVR